MGSRLVDRIHEFLDFWFGNLGTADLPTSDRTNLWFGNNNALRVSAVEKFKTDYERAIKGELDDWKSTARGTLALIILLDQFSRYLNPESDQSFTYDKLAQSICLHAIENKLDHQLTLIERVFFLYAVSAFGRHGFARTVVAALSRSCDPFDD